MEGDVENMQKESGTSLHNLRKKLQSYVWEDMYSWKVLLDIKTDFHLEELHAEKYQGILDLDFVSQIRKIDSEIQAETQRLVDLQNERTAKNVAREQTSDDSSDVDIPILSSRQSKRKVLATPPPVATEDDADKKAKKKKKKN
jgi:hypothetical protein